ncbi:transcriptional repressor LexA [Thiohalophilus thiocyanatoxydans]|uniref:LexA repressor n=1 Tax=Thiohalophilus thiocyanatoxydans TaxID=381308 RepID=A0A4R8IW49_9GAMM|nr:transcriptional repressor LexA [Thiohalophilus thiocyanatoxydans]TDY03730.1 repressor LexA [Thiohalophilus thiocyanatoxydans]
MLTQLEQRILDFIRDYIGDHEHAPTLSEIGQSLEISSKGTVHRYVQSLIEKGELEHVQRGWRGIRLASPTPTRSTTLPLVGRIAAGHPIEAIPGQEELNLSDMFVGRDRYALQIKGDSMIGVGILDGDLVIIEPRDRAEYGDIVVALIDEQEATLKRYKRYADGRVELSPENPDLQPMVFDPRRVRIQGILVGQLRTYQ